MDKSNTKSNTKSNIKAYTNMDEVVDETLDDMHLSRVCTMASKIERYCRSHHLPIFNDPHTFNIIVTHLS